MDTLNPSLEEQAVDFKPVQFVASDRAAAAAGPPGVCAELDRYDIAVILCAAYEWGGFRYSNASDAIAAAKRGRK